MRDSGQPLAQTRVQVRAVDRGRGINHNQRPTALQFYDSAFTQGERSKLLLRTGQNDGVDKASLAIVGNSE